MSKRAGLQLQSWRTARNPHNWVTISSHLTVMSCSPVQTLFSTVWLAGVWRKGLVENCHPEQLRQKVSSKFVAVFIFQSEKQAFYEYIFLLSITNSVAYNRYRYNCARQKGKDYDFFWQEWFYSACKEGDSKAGHRMKAWKQTPIRQQNLRGGPNCSTVLGNLMKFAPASSSIPDSLLGNTWHPHQAHKLYFYGL